MDENIKESPFWPGETAPPEIFVGREDEIDSITRYISQNSQGRQQHVFLYGDIGIGKSSLATYVMDLAKNKNQMMGIHIYLDGTHDVNTLIKDIVENILDEVKDERLHKKIWNMFNVESVNVKGIEFKFKPKTEDLENIKKHFPETLKKVLENMEETKKGIFIILDDINGITKNAEFANWYKSFVDTVSTKYRRNFPVFMMLIGLPDKRSALFKQNQSFMRIFQSREISALTNYEVKEFFNYTFGLVDISVEDNAMNFMVRYSSGMPTMMHEIGEAIFWLMEEHETEVNMEKAINGVFRAGDEIGKKYLQHHMIKNIKSSAYKNILKKLGENVLIEFSKDDLKNILNEEDQRKISGFVSRCKELGIIIQGEHRGTYKFVNNLYPIYFFINGDKI